MTADHAWGLLHLLSAPDFDALMKHFPSAWVYGMRTFMPTVLRMGGLRVVIYPNDHRPAHVHVRGADGEAVFILNCPEGPPELRESYGFKLTDLNGIEIALSASLSLLCGHWSAIHGDN